MMTVTMTLSPGRIVAGLALLAGLAAASTLTVSPSPGLYSGLTVRIEAHPDDRDDCSDVLDNLEVGWTSGPKKDLQIHCPDHNDP